MDDKTGLVIHIDRAMSSSPIMGTYSKTNFKNQYWIERDEKEQHLQLLNMAKPVKV